MQDKINEFQALLERKTDISVTDREKAIKLLYVIYREEKDAKLLAERMILSTHVVASSFAEKYFSAFTEKEIEDICSGVVLQLNAGKTNHQTLYSVGFSVVAYSIIKTKHEKVVMQLLNALVKGCESKEGFGKNKRIAFKKHLLEKSKGTVLKLDYSDWEEKDRKRLNDFLFAVFPSESELKKVSYGKNISDWRGRYGFLKTEKMIPIEPIKNSLLSIEKEKLDLDKVLTSPQKVIEDTPNHNNVVLMEKYIEEIQKLYDNAFRKNNAFESLERKLADEKSKLNLANESILQKDKEIKELHERNMGLQKKSKEQAVEIMVKTEEIEDLNVRLQRSFAVDNITQNQELIALKNNISNSLKLQYADYNDMVSAEMCEDNYKFFKIMLNQMFKTLKKYGIDFDN